MKLALATLALLPIGVSAADTYNIDPEHTFPTFEIGHMGLSIQRGMFENTRGKVVIDWDNKTGSVDVEIDAASIHTGNAGRDEALRGKGFFAVEDYPTINYKSSRIVFKDDKPVKVEGELTIRGISNPVELTLSQFECGFNLLKLANGCGADAIAAIQRSDYGLVSLLPSIGDPIWLRIQIEAYK